MVLIIRLCTIQIVEKGSITQQLKMKQRNSFENIKNNSSMYEPRAESSMLELCRGEAFNRINTKKCIL